MYTLVTAANSSGAYKLKNSLDANTVILGDYLELPEILVNSGKVLRLPNPAEPSYVHQMLAWCLDKHISVIYALREPEMEQLQNSRQLFFEYGIDILAQNDKIR